MKTVVVDNNDYQIEYDQHNDLTFIHCELKTTWTKTVKENLIRDFEVLKELRNAPIYAIHEIGDNKHYKFLQLFGFTLLQDVICTDGVKRQVFITGN